MRPLPRSASEAGSGTAVTAGAVVSLSVTLKPAVPNTAPTTRAPVGIGETDILLENIVNIEGVGTRLQRRHAKVPVLSGVATAGIAAERNGAGVASEMPLTKAW